MEPDDELKKRWNSILKRSGLGAIKPGKPSDAEVQMQRKSKKRGLPKWANKYKLRYAK